MLSTLFPGQCRYQVTPVTEAEASSTSASPATVRTLRAKCATRADMKVRLISFAALLSLILDGLDQLIKLYCTVLAVD